VTDIAGEFSSYTCLAVPLSVKTTDGTDQPVVGKGMVKWTNTLTMSKVLYAFFFRKTLIYKCHCCPIKLCFLFDISKVFFF
jgi:hypothetical protein